MGESLISNEGTARVQTMIKAMVMLLQPDNEKIEGFGKVQFNVMPRVGEYITQNKDVESFAERCQVYKVVAIHHPYEPVLDGTMGDIYIVHVGNLLDHLQSLKHG
jgi:hypothetical protein